MSLEEFKMWSLIAMVLLIALPCARCRCEGLGTDFCLDKQSYFHEDTDLDEQAGTIPDESRQMPIKPKTTTTDTKVFDTSTSGRDTKSTTEKGNHTIPTTTTRKPVSTDKYDDAAILSKFAEDEDVVREDHATQTQYLSDLAVNTDNEITSLHVYDEPQQTFNLAGGERDPFFGFVNDDNPSFEVDGVWSRATRDIHNSDSEEPSSEESDDDESIMYYAL